MSADKRISESTVARIAGNLASGHPAWRDDGSMSEETRLSVAKECVDMARRIVAEVDRTAKD